eukprot:9497091-Pyramimonas_sp.AAC.3
MVPEVPTGRTRERVWSAPGGRVGVGKGWAYARLNTAQSTGSLCIRGDGSGTNPMRSSGDTMGPRHMRIMSARTPLTTSTSANPSYSTSLRQQVHLVARGVPLSDDIAPMPPHSPRASHEPEFSRELPIRSHSGR